MLVTEFAHKHDAYPSWIKAAETLGCKTMADFWANPSMKPVDRMWTATCPDVLPQKELRIFAVWIARQVQRLMTDQSCIEALDVAERYTNGDATDAELAVAFVRCQWVSSRASIAAEDGGRKADHILADTAEVVNIATASSPLMGWQLRLAYEIADTALWHAEDASLYEAPAAEWLTENTNPNWGA